MTIDEAYSKTRYALAEIQYYIDNIEKNLTTVIIIAAIAIIIALAAILFLSYFFWIIKKQEKQLTSIKQQLEKLSVNNESSKEDSKVTNEVTI